MQVLVPNYCKQALQMVPGNKKKNKPYQKAKAILHP
jgi:hypothetical protein